MPGPEELVDGLEFLQPVPPVLQRLGVAGKARRIVYASCDPGSFARDARTLQDGGYRLEKLKAIDQFLWSGHVELVALFGK